MTDQRLRRLKRCWCRLRRADVVVVAIGLALAGGVVRAILGRSSRPPA